MISEPPNQTYILPDIFPPGLRLVLCGTAPGRVSARLQQYYAHPQNKFWHSLHTSGLIPEPLDPADYARLPEWGIGLTDINKTEWGMDHELSAAAADATRLREKILRLQPGMVAFTSKKAASYFFKKPTTLLSYGLQLESVEKTNFWILPSPSPAAQTSWDAFWWKKLAMHLDDTAIESSEKIPVQSI